MVLFFDSFKLIIFSLSNPVGSGHQINKSAILSHLNLNVKAREELEKRKQAAKAAEALAEATANGTAQSESTVSQGRASKSEDNTPAIPITSFTNEDDDQDDDDEDSESNTDETEDNSKESNGINKNKINFDLKKRKLGVIKNTDILDKKKVKSNNDEDESDDSSYFNVFNSKTDSGTNGATVKPKTKNAARLTSKQLAALKTNVKKQPTVKQPILKQTLVKQQISSSPPVKQPILKSGQAQAKDREETKAKQFFIGPKLPTEVNGTATAIGTSIDNETKAGATVDQAEGETVKTVSPKIGQLEINSWAHLNGNMAESSLVSSDVLLSDKPVGPKINYTKDELAKYGDLSMMSQAYAKINQVGVVNFAPNGGAEINMVELDQTQQQQAVAQQQGQLHQLPQAQLIANPNANNAALILHQEQMNLQNESKLQNDMLLEAYHQEQQKNALKAYHLQQQQAAAQQQQAAAQQQQQRSIQLQLQNIQQLRANQQIQQLNGLHNLQYAQAQQYLHAQQLQKVCDSLYSYT